MLAGCYSPEDLETFVTLLYIQGVYHALGKLDAWEIS